MLYCCLILLRLFSSLHGLLKIAEVAINCRADTSVVTVTRNGFIICGAAFGAVGAALHDAVLAVAQSLPDLGGGCLAHGLSHGMDIDGVVINGFCLGGGEMWRWSFVRRYFFILRI